jgi:erythronate-4-phosphate dehydrogenase
MLIVADENIPLLDEFFSGMGHVRRLPGRQIRRADVADADVLLVRSVTRVDEELVEGSRLRFVGSATIGTDHVDQDALARAGIAFAAAPGCNARAVAEYVATLLVRFAAGQTQALQALSLGVVGCGNVGRAVVSLAQRLGMRVRVSDPLLTSAFPAGAYPVALDELMAVSDVISLHVPLTRGGPAPTHHLLDAARLHAGRWQLLINTARGAVVDNQALLALLRSHPGRRVALDVWEQEPLVPGELLARMWHASPHVAGYSSEGKWRGTAMVYRAACQALALPPVITLEGVLQARGDAVEPLSWPGALDALLLSCCPTSADDARLRASADADGDVSPGVFDGLRRDYPARREFAHYRVQGLPADSDGQRLDSIAAETETPQVSAAFLRNLGFD